MRPLSALALGAYAAPLVLAAVSDFRTFRIPNAVVGALALLYPLAALALGRAADMPQHLLVGAAVLSIGAPLFALRVMGGGDVKLMSAAALWVGTAGIVDFIFMTALLGGVFAFAVLVSRGLGKSAARRIPYGIPIAAAGLMLAPDILLAH